MKDRSHVTTKTAVHGGCSRREFMGGALAAVAAVPILGAVVTSAAEDRAGTTRLWIGTATVDITPKPPVALTGFQTVRITSTIQSPLTANVLALESRDGDQAVDQAILISCDLCVIRPGVQDEFRKFVAGRLPGFDVQKLFLAATHTHSAPVTVQTQYDEKDYGDATQPKDYLPFLYERMADAVARAWEGRSVGAMGHGLAHAVVGQNRRIVYADGRAQMSFEPNDPQFRHIEGYEDHAVDILCFYDSQRALKATVITLACTAQMSQGETVVSADFWHDARELLRVRYGGDLCVLGFCAPSGDQCPHLSYRKRSEARMDRLRGLTRTQELGRRIAEAFFDAADVIVKDVRDDMRLTHLVRHVDLPTRIITDDEYAIAKRVCDGIDAKPEHSGWDGWVRRLYGGVCGRYQDQQLGNREYSMELHVLRLGDVAIATNPFELYVDYGIQIQARSAAEQTILIQLAATGEQDAYYVPTPRAVAGGGFSETVMNNYSATVMTNVVGPEGGQVLVERTLDAIRELFAR
ncbi:MAG: hypothetical protein FJ276_10335 [Planctomycetes bacterium]|nr:hypothetical protein [Planctomycetota bacterium]